ncbi:MAG: 16S rRNA (cytidine(1402)-2'-O)-methyltransferase [Parcubacteria group bacterium RIFOXYD2_FULL_52_8]|nr:MAG: 16S rRNA (cytidine(1402)-2'-O)-methyltransferase [Parcubacteria group bacterium RIFOXYD2_FULL_52_8]
MATLSLVATPIGNLEDITLRALRVLKEADLVLCEDTRVTRKLLAHHGLRPPVQSFHEHSTDAKLAHVLALLSDDKKIALVTDAGTPGVSDPGAVLVRAVRAHLPEVHIEAIPGPSALTAFLSVAGLLQSDFLFLGFLPHKKGRVTLFKEMAISPHPVLFYESPHRILRALESLSQYVDKDRQIVIGRELTKFYEEVHWGTADELLAFFDNHTDKVKGEFVVMVLPKARIVT